jgi:hypothetical protein
MNDLEIEARDYAQGSALARLKKLERLPTWDDLNALEVTL